MKPYFDEDGITIYHGDCREMDLAALGADVVVTDPPYGIAYVHGAEKSPWASRFNGVPVVGDEVPFDPRPLLAVAPKLILWGANHYADRLPSSPSWLVWDKRGGSGMNDQADCEMAWTNLGGPARMFYLAWSGWVRGGGEKRAPRVHPTQKPLAVMRWCLGRTGGSVLDPYAGSGTTLVAAQQCGRRAIGIEIEERYCEIAVQRLAQRTLWASPAAQIPAEQPPLGIG